MLILIKGITRVLKMNYILINDFWGSPIRRKLLFVWFFTHTQAAIFFQNGRRFHRSFVFYLVYVLKEHLSSKSSHHLKKSWNSYYQGLKKYNVTCSSLLGSWALLCWFFSARFHGLSCTGSSLLGFMCFPVCCCFTLNKTF